MDQPVRRAYHDVSDKDLAMARRMYVKGYGVTQLAIKFRRSHHAVAAWVEGLERGPKLFRRAEDWEIEAARRLRREGKSLTVIARLMERSDNTVRYWIRDLPPPERSKPKEKTQKQLQAERGAAQREQRARQRREVLRLYQKGNQSRGNIALEVGVNLETVTRWVKEAGLELRTWSNRRT